VSNGSLMTAPDVKGRLDGIRARGGKIIVIDPRRTETAARADEHIAIRPGGDAALLLAMVHVLFEENLVRLGAAEGLVRGLDEVRGIAAGFAPSGWRRARVDAATIRRLAREHAAAPTAACYGRIGTTCQEFGTLASWAVDLINVLTGNLDRAMRRVHEPGGDDRAPPQAQRRAVRALRQPGQGSAGDVRRAAGGDAGRRSSTVARAAPPGRCRDGCARW
jgi:anaerobic selenocysteine-containing dehydrogenase